MNVFISHAPKDEILAAELADQLTEAGIHVLGLSEEDSAVGNRPLQLGRALEKADFMLILLTPGTRNSDTLHSEIDYALSSKKFKGRMLSVFVGPTAQMGEDIPWILLKYPHKHISSLEEGAEEVVKSVLALQVS